MSLGPHLITHKLRRSGLLDFGLGFSMLRDRNVSARLKLVALFFGLLATMGLEALEVPLEAVVGFLLPILGPALDLAFDGIEYVILPLLFAALILPLLVRQRSRVATDYPQRR